MFGIGEKIHHAYLMWWKFHGYGDAVPTTFGHTMTIFTYIASLLILISGFMAINKKKDKYSEFIIKFSSSSLILGLLLLTVLLISPYGELVRR